MSELVRREATAGIVTVTLDSPANRNALSAQLVGEVSAHLAGAAADDGVRAIVLTHTGSVFCAGADLKEQTGKGGPEQGTARMLGLLRQIVELRKPVVARVDGAVRAGGVGLVGACDLAFVTRATSFAFTEVRLGLAPAIISLTTLSRLSERAASRYLLTGERFDGAIAAAIGLVTGCADDAGALDAEVTALLAELRACSPQGLAETKALTTATVRAAFAERGDEVQAQSARLFASDEAREGMLAFLQKRPPRWAP